MTTIEQAYTALFARLQQLQGAPFVTMSRRARIFSDLDPVEHPALYVLQRGRHNNPLKQGPYGLQIKRTLYCDLLIYVWAEDDEVVSTKLNNAVDAVEACLKPDAPKVQPLQTLGGVVEHAYVSGTSEDHEGTLANQGVTIIPVEMLITTL